MNLILLIDQAIAEGLTAHKGYLTAYGQEDGRAQKMLVRKVAKAWRESLSAPKDDDAAEAAADTPKPSAPQGEYWQCEVWSKEWWALLFATIERGKSVTFMLDYAMRSEKGAIATVARAQQPPADLIERMQSFPSDGEVARLWRLWLARKNVRLPDWRGKMWVFLPAPEPPPPEESSAA